MEKYSFIKFTFNDDLSTGTVSFDYGNGNDWKTVSESWTPVRFSQNQVSEGIPTDIVGERSAINFMAAFNSDYNVTGLFTVDRNANEVTIWSTNIDIYFPDSSISVPADVTATAEKNQTVPFSITSIGWSAGSPVCFNVNAIITTSSQATSYNIGLSDVPVSTNPFTVPLERSTDTILTVKKGSLVIQRIVPTHMKLLSSSINVDVDFSPNGSIVTFNIYQPTGGAPQLALEYSLDGTNYQTSNSFSGILGGTYTVRVRDQFGCIAAKTFEVGSGILRSPFFSVSKSNPIRFKNNIVWGDSANYKNDENTLSCESDVPLPYQYIQQFQSSDIITCQFRSNYANNSAAIAVNGGLFHQTPLTQISNNIGLKDSRDARKYNMYPLIKTGIYFISGNTYDFDLGTVTGNYTLNGGLPEWAKVGNFILLEYNGTEYWKRIEDVIFDETKNAEVIVVNGMLAIGDVSCVVKSIFNRQNYEVYQFSINMFPSLDKRIQVRIKGMDSLFPDVEYLSEIIEVKVRFPKTVDITYKNRTNTDLVFAFGLECRIRVELEKKYGKPIEETETYKTDSSAILLKANIHEADVFEFTPVTKQIMWLLVRALSHTNVKIDGVDYVIDGVPDVSEALGKTNLYEVKVTMLKARNVYDSDSGIYEFGTGVIEIPALIETGTGYVKYQ